jgi:hypothetical protein
MTQPSVLVKTKGFRLLYIPVLLLTAGGCYWLGRRDVWIGEFKVYSADLARLTQYDTNLPPELKEFAKGRYYYVANKVPKSWLGSPYDYGPVATNLASFPVGKGDTSAGNEYRIFKERGVPLRQPK